MTRKLANKNKKKENRSKEIKPEFTHSAIFFFIKPKEDLVGGTTAAKTSPPPCDRSGVAGTGALEELKFDGRLLQENKSKFRTKRGVQQNKNKKTTHRLMTRAASSSSSSSFSDMATITPSEKGEKYSVKGTNKQQQKMTKHIDMLT